MAAFLDTVEEALQQALGHEAPEVARRPRVLLEAARHLSLATDAKRARPQLVHHFGQALGVEQHEGLVDVAVAAELMHAASLLHDDVIDGGATRRGIPTANVRWSNTVAVLSGDMLLCLALMRLGPYPTAILRESVDTVARMTAGVMKEVECRAATGQPATLDEWRSIAAGKTGALLEWCGRSAGRLAGRDETVVEQLGAVGLHLGIAFQLGDDIIDFLPQASGKSGHADLKTGNPSYVVIRACELEPTLYDDLERVRRKRSGSGLHEVAMRIVRSGALEDAMEAMWRELQLVDSLLVGLGIDRSESPISMWSAALLHRIEAAHAALANERPQSEAR